MKKNTKKQPATQRDSPDHVRVPYFIFSHPLLRPIEKSVYGAIYWSSYEGQQSCKKGNKELAEFIGTTPFTVSNAISKLVTMDFVKRILGRNRELIPLIIGNKIPLNVIAKISSPLTQRLKNPSTHRLFDLNPQVISPSPVDLGLHIYLKEPKRTEPDTPETGSPEKESESDGDGESQSGQPTGKKNNIAPPLTFTQKLAGMKKFESKDNIPASLISEAIATFLPIFPTQFTGKSSPFAIPATRDAVQNLLLTKSLDEIKSLIDCYLEGAEDRFRPVATNVYAFCTYKLEAIESWAKKPTSALWQHRRISTPEQSRARDVQYKNRVEEIREKQRLNKERWEQEHKNQ